MDATTQPNSIKRSELQKRYNSQHQEGIATKPQNKTTTQTTQTDITCAQEKQTEAYHPTEAKRHTHLTLQDTTSAEETYQWQRRREKYLPKEVNRP